MHSHQCNPSNPIFGHRYCPLCTAMPFSARFCVYLIVCAISVRPGTQVFLDIMTLSFSFVGSVFSRFLVVLFPPLGPSELGYLALRASKHGNLHAKIHMKFVRIVHSCRSKTIKPGYLFQTQFIGAPCPMS